MAGGVLVGVALTCDCGANDNLALAAAVAESEPGDVIVAGTGGFAGASVIGDLLLGIAKNRGVVGFVTDGMCATSSTSRRSACPSSRWA